MRKEYPTRPVENDPARVFGAVAARRENERHLLPQNKAWDDAQAELQRRLAEARAAKGILCELEYWNIYAAWKEWAEQ